MPDSIVSPNTAPPESATASVLAGAEGAAHSDPHRRSAGESLCPTNRRFFLQRALSSAIAGSLLGATRSKPNVNAHPASDAGSTGDIANAGGVE
jgi:hypothetical protein